MSVNSVRYLSLLVALLITAPSNLICQEADSVKIRRTHPTGALLRSALVPGWGQLYSRKYIKAVIIAGLEGYLINGIYSNWRKADYHEKRFKSAFDNPEYQADQFAKYEKALEKRSTKMWFLAATIFLSMFDAYVDAQLSDFDQTDKAFEVHLGPGRDSALELSLTIKIP